MPNPRQVRTAGSDLSRSKSLTILDRGDERLHHLRTHKVAIELIQLRQPEIISRVIRVRRIIRIAAQIANVLQQHKCPVEFLTVQGGVLGYASQGSSSGR